MEKIIGIDLGTTNVLVYIPKRGIVVNEPSVVAISKEDRRVLAVGAEANCKQVSHHLFVLSGNTHFFLQ